MNEPILGKSPPHVLDYKPITWGAFIELRNACQKLADTMDYPVYLVGSTTYKELPRDIDISIIIPLDEYEELFGKLPEKQDDYEGYLSNVIHKTCKYYKDEFIDLQFCIDYHLDIKICPDTWWTEKPKFLLAEPKKTNIKKEGN